MVAFFDTYKWELIYIGLIIVLYFLLRLITNKMYKWSLKRFQKRYPNEKSRSLIFLKRLLRTLWLVLGVIAISFVFLEGDSQDRAEQHFEIAIFLGIVAVLTIALSSSLNLWFRKGIRGKIQRKEDSTNLRFLRYVVVYGVYFIGILVGLSAFPSMRSFATTALGGAGVIAIVAGIASQEALANVVSGIFIIMFRPFRIGETVKIADGMQGTIQEITLRHTVIRNYENKMIVVPNAIINKERLLNYDLGEPKCCEHIEIGISYDSDIDLAKKIMQEECENHPYIMDNRNDLERHNDEPKVRTALIKLDESSVVLRAWAWSVNYSDSFRLRCDVLESIKKRFDAEGIEIPFPYRTVVIKNKKEDSPQED